MHVIETLDGYGRAGWITLMVVSFILFWPVGLGVLAFLIWSGRMGNFGGDAWRNDMRREMKTWGCGAKRWARHANHFRPTGNAAFDEYREETLKKLEDEAEEFRQFLTRLREARDKAEFDQFMSERNRGGQEPGTAV
ncbi:hypothetical protein A7A08_00874 [Methyloligella halotolerans]|uniref:DUF2852 domain-containing protein n=1 Tax=Methyloligella halotolerans TaxID=1177755 RepID=A0A1E2S3Y7_9HYPH|nr:DUF2852 domain-containing protein [Methyloligella halotolerans]ODA69038.1 hypothetical protein A7A08_00874 [Methyloligella halotolerans]